MTTLSLPRQFTFTYIQLTYLGSNAGSIHLHAEAELAAAPVFHHHECAWWYQLMHPSTERSSVDFKVWRQMCDAEITDQRTAEEVFQEFAFGWMMATFALPVPVTGPPKGSANSDRHPLAMHKLAATINSQTDCCPSASKNRKQSLPVRIAARFGSPLMPSAPVSRFGLSRDGFARHTGETAQALDAIGLGWYR